jgi:hypothetical protein
MTTSYICIHEAPKKQVDERCFISLHPREIKKIKGSIQLDKSDHSTGDIDFAKTLDKFQLKQELLQI